MPYQLDPSSFDRAPSNLPGTATVNVQEQSIQIPQYVFWAIGLLLLKRFLNNVQERFQKAQCS